MADVQDVLEAYRRAVAGKDVEALLALYDPAVRVFDLWGAWLHPDREAWRAAVQQWFGSLGEEGVEVEFTDLRVVEGRDVAACHLLVTYAGVSAAGDRLRAMLNRLTWVLRRDGEGAWKIVHEHTSAPADLESSRVMLQR